MDKPRRIVAIHDFETGATVYPFIQGLYGGDTGYVETGVWDLAGRERHAGIIRMGGDETMADNSGQDMGGRRRIECD